MTKEQLQQRLDALQKEYLDALARVNAIAGAMADCQFWLGELTKPAEAPKAEEAPTPAQTAGPDNQVPSK